MTGLTWLVVLHAGEQIPFMMALETAELRHRFGMAIVGLPDHMNWR